MLILHNGVVMLSQKCVFAGGNMKPKPKNDEFRPNNPLFGLSFGAPMHRTNVMPPPPGLNHPKGGRIDFNKVKRSNLRFIK